MNTGATSAMLLCFLHAALGSDNCDNKAKIWKWQKGQGRSVAREQTNVELRSARNSLKQAQNSYNASRKRSTKLSNEMNKLERSKHKLISEIACSEARNETDGETHALIRAHKGRYLAVNSLEETMREVSAKHMVEMGKQSQLLREIEQLEQKIQTLERDIRSPPK